MLEATAQMKPWKYVEDNFRTILHSPLGDVKNARFGSVHLAVLKSRLRVCWLRELYNCSSSNHWVSAPCPPPPDKMRVETLVLPYLSMNLGLHHTFPGIIDRL